MDKKKKNIGLVLALATIIVVISGAFIFKMINTPNFSQESVQTLLSKGATVHSFKKDEHSFGPSGISFFSLWT